MLQMKCFVAFLLVLSGTFAAAAQNTSSSRQAAIAEAKKASAGQMAKPAVVPESLSSAHVIHPAALDRHALMMTRHPDIAAALTQANLPASGKAYSFPELSKASFLSPANARSDVFPASKASHINTRKLRMTKPREVRPLH